MMEMMIPHEANSHGSLIRSTSAIVFDRFLKLGVHLSELGARRR